MKDFGGWARKTAEEMAVLMETGVKKAEVALNKATDKVVDFTVGQKPGQQSPTAADDAGPAIPDPTPPNAPAKAGKKSIGKKKKGSPRKATASKKSLGKAPAADDESAE